MKELSFGMYALSEIRGAQMLMTTDGFIDYFFSQSVYPNGEFSLMILLYVIFPPKIDGKTKGIVDEETQRRLLCALIDRMESRAGLENLFREFVEQYPYYHYLPGP